jgi:hypothetical protein
METESKILLIRLKIISIKKNKKFVQLQNN